MSYIDDWYHTPKTQRDELEKQCKRPDCDQFQYQHGRVRIIRNGEYRYVEHKPGPCTVCPCKEFADKVPLTIDDVLDAEIALRAEVRLSDLGIDGIVRCTVDVMKYTAEGPVTQMCGKDPFHSGDHDW